MNNGDRVRLIPTIHLSTTKSFALFTIFSKDYVHCFAAKAIIDKSRGEVPLLEQDTIENVS